MSDHVLQTKNYGSDRFIGKCSCRLQSSPVEYRQQVDDWYREHMVQVERARTGLGSKTPTLERQLKHYRSMEETGPRRDRTMWKQLADELEQRIGPSDPHEGMEPLF